MKHKSLKINGPEITSGQCINGSLPMWHTKRQERRLQETEMCFELMAYLLRAHQQKVLPQARRTFFFFLGNIVCTPYLAISWKHANEKVEAFSCACWNRYLKSLIKNNDFAKAVKGGGVGGGTGKKDKLVVWFFNKYYVGLLSLKWSLLQWLNIHLNKPSYKIVIFLFIITKFHQWLTAFFCGGVLFFPIIECSGELPVKTCCFPLLAHMQMRPSAHLQGKCQISVQSGRGNSWITWLPWLQS